MSNEQNQFESEDQNNEENFDQEHPEANEEDIDFNCEIPDNFFELLEIQKEITPHYKKLVKIIAKTNILKNKEEILRKHNYKINNIIENFEKLTSDKDKETFKIEINAKKNLTNDELADTMKILNFISETDTTQDTDLEIVLAILKKILNFINSSLSRMEHLDLENPKELYKKLWNNKLSLEDVISTLELLDFN